MPLRSQRSPARPCACGHGCGSQDGGSQPDRRASPRPVLPAGRDGRSADAAAPPTGGGAVEYPVTAGSHPHDVAPAADGGVWYTGQHNGTLGHLDPTTGEVREIDLGAGSAPHGVIVGRTARRGSPTAA